MIELSPKEQLMLSSVSINPTTQDLLKLDSLIPRIESWNEVAQQLIDRGLAPLFYVKLPNLVNASLIPQKVVTKLKHTYFITLSRNMILYDAFDKMAKAFRQQEIPFIALKGIYLSEILYKDIGLRQLSDIDILINPTDADNCLKTLYDLGYRSSNDKQFEFIREKVDFIHFDPMVLNGVSIEVHIRLLHKNSPYNIPTEVCFNRAQSVVIHQNPVLTLGSIEHLIFVCLHFYKHFTAGHIQFTSITDISNLIDTELNKIDYLKLIQRCREYNCEDDVFRAFLLVNKYCNSSIPTHFILDHQHLLKEEHEKLFIRYLNGYNGKHFTVQRHLNDFKKINKVSEKIRYLLYMAFPTKAYMMRSYHINNPKIVWLYYPYRFFIGIKGWGKMIFKK